MMFYFLHENLCELKMGVSDICTGRGSIDRTAVSPTALNEAVNFYNGLSAPINFFSP